MPIRLFVFHDAYILRGVHHNQLNQSEQTSQPLNTVQAGGILVILSTILMAVYIRMYAWVSTTYTLLEDVKSFCAYFGPVIIVSLKLVGAIMILVAAATNPSEYSMDSLYTTRDVATVAAIYLRWDGIMDDKVARYGSPTFYPLPECLKVGFEASRILGIVSGSLALPVVCIMVASLCCWDRFKVSVLRFVLCSFGWLDGMFALIAIILFKTTTCGGSEDCSLPYNSCFSQYDKGSFYDIFVTGGALIVTSSLVSIPYLLFYLTTIGNSNYNNNDDVVNQDLPAVPSDNDTRVVVSRPSTTNDAQGTDGGVIASVHDVGDFKCGICYLTYTTDPVRRPCICRSCGNTLCHACTFCRAAIDPSKVVPNIAILQMLEKPRTG